MPKRKNPVASREDRMSRSDSLASMGEFGSIVKPSEQDSVRAARRKDKALKNPFQKLMNAISGGRK